MGQVELRTAGGKLVRVRLCSPGADCGRPERGERIGPHMRAFARWLEAYFEGCPPEADLSRIDLSGATDFERSVYRVLANVRFGRLTTYGQLARYSGAPGAARAVGRAMGRNPVPIFIPCHRVVRSDGRLGGFGAGTEWKARLLTHEGWAVTGEKIIDARRAVSDGTYAESDRK